MNKYDKTADFYGTTINLSHLIHELGHAVASQKDEYIQNESGDYIHTVGTAVLINHVDKNNKTVEKEKQKVYLWKKH